MLRPTAVAVVPIDNYLIFIVIYLILKIHRICMDYSIHQLFCSP